MKKILTLLSVIALSSSLSFGQEAFKHLGVSLEVGSTGAGVNVSVPVVTNCLILSVGCNFPTIPFSFDINDVGTTGINNKIKEANDMIDKYNAAIDAGLSGTKVSNVPDISDDEKLSADITTKINFFNAKAMLEWYPTKQSSFHVTAGVFVGNGEWITINAKADQEIWKTYQAAVAANNMLPATPVTYNGTTYKRIDGMDELATVTLQEHTYCMKPESNGEIDAKFIVNKVKPYIGLGFGSSIPTKHRFGFQLEVGAYYQGGYTLKSSSEIEYNGEESSATVDDILETIGHFKWYPQVSFRWTGRIF